MSDPHAQARSLVLRQQSLTAASKAERARILLAVDGQLAAVRDQLKQVAAGDDYTELVTIRGRLERVRERLGA